MGYHTNVRVGIDFEENSYNKQRYLQTVKPLLTVKLEIYKKRTYK